MPLAQSRVTAQGQISVPARIRQKLGIGPGSVLEWEDEDGRIVVRKAGRFTSQEIHRALFEQQPRPRSLAQLKDGIRASVRRRRARR